MGQTVNTAYALAVSMTLILVTMFPQESHNLWLYPLRAWNSIKARWLVMKERGSDGKAKPFIEVDMRDFR